MKIYLAGKIPKGEEIGVVSDWRKEYADVLGAIPGVEFLSPEDEALDESQSFLVFGHDCHLIERADAIIVNASIKLGVGTAQEMLIAKYFRKPVVSIVPKNTHHRRVNLRMPAGLVPDWIHPFISSTSDVVVEGVQEAAEWLGAYLFRPADFSVKGLEIIDNAIRSYSTVGIDVKKPPDVTNNRLLQQTLFNPLWVRKIVKNSHKPRQPKKREPSDNQLQFNL